MGEQNGIEKELNYLRARSNREELGSHARAAQHLAPCSSRPARNQERKVMTQRKTTDIQQALIAALADPSTDAKTRSIAAKHLGDIETLQKKLALVRARKEVIAQNQAAREKKKDFGI
jgi:hypothetical protein